MPAVTVTLTGNNTNITSKTTTNEAGFYIFPGVVPGPYLLTVVATGMANFEGSLTAETANSMVVDVTMKVGKTTTEVSVKDVTPIVQTDNATLGGTLQHTQIEQLPINGRTVMTLLEMIPGMEGTGRSFGIRDGSFDVLLDGAAIADRLDYALGSGTGNGARITYRQPGLDSIQEFTVENNSVSAKCSRPTCVVMTTKGGTNRLHGSAFETNRNNAIGLARSRTDYYTSPPFLNRNEFGVSAGGPVYIPKVYNGKNKTFWFFSYEGLRNVSASSMGFSVPTQAMRNGDMSGLVNGNGIADVIYNPFSTDPNTWSRQPYVNNQIPASQENPLAKTLFAVTPLPTLANVNPLVGSNWYGPISNPTRSWTTSARIDQHFSDKDQFYGRYTQGNYNSRSEFYSLPTTNPTQIPANTESILAPNKSAAASWVHMFSPTLFNELLVTGSRQAQWDGTGDPTVNYDSQLGLPNPFNFAGWPFLNSAGLGGNYEFEGQNTNAWHSFYGLLDDNASKVFGKHQIQFGFHFRYDQMNEMPDQQYTSGLIDWATGATALYDPSTSRSNPQALPYTGEQLANFYLGVAEYAAQLNHSYFYYRQKQYAGYIQDNFRATSRLTVNVGLRWEYWSPINEKNHSIASFDVADHAEVLGTSLTSLYQMGATTPAIVNRLQQLGMKFETYQQAGMPQSLMTTDHRDFGPRLGFAYKALDGAKAFVLRGGYSIEYFPIPLYGYGARMRKNSPFTTTFQESITQASYSPDGISNIGMRSVPTIFAGVNDLNAISLDPSISLQPGSANISFFGLHQPDPQVQNWNLTLEKQIIPDTVLRFGFVGNHSAHLEQLLQVNQSTPTYIWYLTTGQPLPTGSLSGVATNNYDQQVISRLEQWQNTGWGNSNGIQVEIQRRFSKGYAYQFFYVLDNALSAGGQSYSGTSLINATNQYLPNTMPTDAHQYDRLLDYQRDTTVPHNRFRWDWVADLPIGKGKALLGNASRVVDKILGGWQVTGIGSANSTYFTLPSGDFSTGVPVQIYGYKYPIQNCTSGTCYPGYLWWNGYIPSTQINTPNGYQGIPADYKPAVAPLIPYGQTALPPNAPAGTNVSSYWGTNTVWVPINNGTVQRTTWSGLAPLRQQYLPSVWQWGMDASLVKNFPIKESFRFRLQVDFFNVLNHPGNPNSVGSTGILSTQSSGNSPRTLQLSGRMTW
jgi:hypothetical protein